MIVQPPYSALPSAYFIHVCLHFYTWRNRPVLQLPQQCTIQSALAEICAHCEYHLLAKRIRSNRVEVLFSLQPQQPVAQVVSATKTNLSRCLFLAHPQLESEVGKRRIWAGSYQVETTGAASTAQIKAYVDDQREHHQVRLQAPLRQARYAAPDRASYQQFQHKGRSVYRLHYHFVFTVKHFKAALDEEVAAYLTDALLRIGDAKGYTLLAFDILDSHVHVLVSAAPGFSAQSIAETLMNNTSVMTLRRFAGLRQEFPGDQLWVPGFFVRSVGRTTAQVKAALCGE